MSGRVLPFGTFTPTLGEDTALLPGSFVIGQVTLGTQASVWYGTVVRADSGKVSVGRDSNLQDGVVVHADPGYPTRIGARVTVGHRAVVHGATVEDECIIGMGAVLLNGSRVGSGSIVAAGSVVRQGEQLPAGSLIAGSPAVVKRAVSDAEREIIAHSWRHYIELARAHTAMLADR